MTKRRVLLLVIFSINIVFSATIKADNSIYKGVQKPNVLAVFAHPDDETWINGTLAKIASEGHPITIVYGTSGNRGSDRSGQDLSGSRLATVRENEARNALTALGIQTTPTFLRFDDTSLHDNIQRLSHKIASIATHSNTNTLLTFGPGGMTGHQDHIAVGLAANLAFDATNSLGILLHIAMSETRAQGLSAIAEKHGVKKYLPKERIPKEAVDIEVQLMSYSEKRQTSPKAHLTQFPQPILSAWDEFVTTFPVEEIVISRKRQESDPLGQMLRDVLNPKARPITAKPE